MLGSKAYRNVVVTEVVALVLAIFLLDTQVRLGVAIGALYAVPILVVLTLRSRTLVVAVAAIATILIVLKLALWPIDQAVAWQVYANRAICVLITWGVAYLGRRVMETRDQRARVMESLLTVCAWTKEVKVGSTWMSFEDFLTKELGLHLTHGISPDVAERLLHDHYIDLQADPNTPI